MMMVVIIMTMKMMMMMMKIIKYHENIAFFELQNTLTDGFRKKVFGTLPKQSYIFKVENHNNGKHVLAHPKFYFVPL